jgi:hypothetical protein
MPTRAARLQAARQRPRPRHMATVAAKWQAARQRPRPRPMATEAAKWQAARQRAPHRPPRRRTVTSRRSWSTIETLLGIQVC